MEINREMLLQSFREETGEILAQMEQSFLALETHPEDRELISSLFRAAHTIKGNASLLEFETLAHSVHALEDLLDALRRGAVDLTPEAINLFLQSVDAIREMAQRAVEGEETLLPAHKQLFLRMAQIAGESKTAGRAGTADAAFSPSEHLDEGGASKGAAKNLRVEVSKLDRMLNLSVEFTIAQGRLRRKLEEKNAAASAGREVLEINQGLEALFLELQ